MDATDNQTRFGLPSSFIQGKEALVRNNENYRIIKVPIVEAKDNLSKDFIKIKLENTKMIGDGNLSINGLMRSFILRQIGDATDKARFEMIKSLTMKGNNKFQLNDFTENNLSNRDLPYEINYQFELDNYAVKAGNDLYLNLFLDKPLEKSTIEKDRISKYEFDFLAGYDTTCIFEIPTDYEVKSIPKNVAFSNELMQFDIQYIKLENSIQLSFKMQTHKLMLETNQFQAWNDALKNLKSAYSETITLSKK